MEEGAERDQQDHPLLSLFHHLWFYHPILSHHPSPPTPPPPPSPPLRLLIEPIPLALPQHRPRHRRSLSEELFSSAAAPSRPSPPKLQTIFSGKEAALSDKYNRQDVDTSVEIQKISSKKKQRQRRRSSKSLSDLEFEELQGFMDLGFTFSDAETDPRLMSIVPGLQRRGRRAAAEDGDSASKEKGLGGDSVEEDKVSVSRPYLSEAWATREEEEMLRKWRIPAAAEGADLKDHLRHWAQAVASTVR